ncbi:trans-sulfuration enzyme family protein [Thauera linaloolentis]|uniref:Cystathionine beta-lyase/cystathionine gamma-synthase n=1 Tax=Thauera linaloolentis (strain DSM 12138 / JCM 21573 / CCUG 41526 / CIP 105981 / IAM 15112 / NBRC 102519 / 47Lol) TaxID=1123367 RepID=N6Z1N1_THAL4|nr:PLP-dependent aspartate aminotransferase family protein [Thauera linaloolentis]ENO86079.1 cystathionine beta-lyase/cystathionine gamma-synthase [Thauera linaloolentis 47Lol = DSM 12138]MCM8565228.1 PLP-dependent aspartate aminotransferase family protein [Thauera linaloolentis]
MSSLETLTVHGLGRVADPYRDIVPPIHLASTFERAADGSYPGGRVYARDGSPAYIEAEEVLRRLEGGAQALLFASGHAAATAVLQALEPGDRVVAPHSMYWALRKWLLDLAEHGRIQLAFYDNADIDGLRAQLAAAPTRLLWIETPANPTWEVTDIRAAAALAREHGAATVVDSTVATPVLCQPLALGADIVMHSATKYLNGHSDVVAGALATREDSPLWQRIRVMRNLGGGILGPFEAWLLLRGMRTLHLRVRAACANALRLAAELEAHPAIAQVLYPGLPSHPGHVAAAAQMRGGFGGMLSIRLKDGEAKARDVAARVRVFKRATSLGSVESLIEHRASVEGEGSRCPPDLLRLSVGIEPADDLLADLRQALAD